MQPCPLDLNELRLIGTSSLFFAMVRNPPAHRIGLLKSALREHAKEHASTGTNMAALAKALVLWPVLLIAGVRFQWIFCLAVAVRILDDRTDGRRIASDSQEESLDEYLRATDQYIKRLKNGEQPCMSVVPPEYSLLIGSAEYFAKHGVPEIYEELFGIWQCFQSDAWRFVAGDPLPAARTVAKARKANARFLVLCLRCLGAEVEIARATVSLINDDFLYGDTLADLQDDVDHGFILITRKELVHNGINPDLLLRARGWDQILEVPGVRTWYEQSLLQLEKRWQSQKPALKQNLSAMMSNPTSVAATRMLILNQHAHHMKVARSILTRFPSGTLQRKTTFLHTLAPGNAHKKVKSKIGRDRKGQAQLG